jgi:hypothetical protein
MTGKLRLLLISIFIFAAADLAAQDNSINAKLTADLNKRVPGTRNVSLNWASPRFGYYARYTIDNVEYMSLYDKQGVYKETLEKKPWDDRVPEIIRAEFGNSAYNMCSVLTFWESMQTYNKDFYLELMDRDGKSQATWVDENGRFSNQPGFFQ